MYIHPPLSAVSTSSVCWLDPHCRARSFYLDIPISSLFLSLPPSLLSVHPLPTLTSYPLPVSFSLSRTSLSHVSRALISQDPSYISRSRSLAYLSPALLSRALSLSLLLSRSRSRSRSLALALSISVIPGQVSAPRPRARAT